MTFEVDKKSDAGNFSGAFHVQDGQDISKFLRDCCAIF